MIINMYEQVWNGFFYFKTDFQKGIKKRENEINVFFFKTVSMKPNLMRMKSFQERMWYVRHCVIIESSHRFNI